MEGIVSRSRNGILRNTDSFFKDDTVETKKISLTPNLLRDDSGNTGPATEMKEVILHYLLFSFCERGANFLCFT